MLIQLRQSGKFEGVRGIVFGEMNDCMQHPQQTYTLEEVVLRIVGNLGVPVAYGLRSGHVTQRNITVPIGVAASLVVSEAKHNSNSWSLPPPHDRERRAEKNDRQKTHPPDWNLRHRDGFARRPFADPRHRVTGSDTAAYPPMSDFLLSLGIEVAQRSRRRISTPAPIWSSSATSFPAAMWNLEHILDTRIPFCSLPQILHHEFLQSREVLAIAVPTAKPPPPRCCRGFSTPRDAIRRS